MTNQENKIQKMYEKLKPAFRTNALTCFAVTLKRQIIFIRLFR